MSTVVADRSGLAVALYVATDLVSWETDEPDLYAVDVVVNGRAYRRLDAAYYVWLRSRMVVAMKAVDTGRIAVAPFEELRARFNAVHAWAIEHLGEPALREAVRTFRVSTYRPPQVEDDEPGMVIDLTGSELSGASAPDTPTPEGGEGETGMAGATRSAQRSVGPTTRPARHTSRAGRSQAPSLFEKSGRG